MAHNTVASPTKSLAGLYPRRPSEALYKSSELLYHDHLFPQAFPLHIHDIGMSYATSLTDVAVQLCSLCIIPSSPNNFQASACLWFLPQHLAAPLCSIPCWVSHCVIKILEWNPSKEANLEVFGLFEFWVLVSNCGCKYFSEKQCNLAVIPHTLAFNALH